jgi:hypothetical protein
MDVAVDASTVFERVCVQVSARAYSGSRSHSHTGAHRSSTVRRSPTVYDASPRFLSHRRTLHCAVELSIRLTCERDARRVECTRVLTEAGRPAQCRLAMEHLIGRRTHHPSHSRRPPDLSASRRTRGPCALSSPAPAIRRNSRPTKDSLRTCSRQPRCRSPRLTSSKDDRIRGGVEQYGDVYGSRLMLTWSVVQSRRGWNSCESASQPRVRVSLSVLDVMRLMSSRGHIRVRIGCHPS